MKKTISVLLAAVLLFSLAACGSAAQTQPASQQIQESVEETAPPEAVVDAEAEQQPATDAEASEGTGSSILVLF
nr:YgdI/YgdR family lipoprotein [Oscillospiraceae bacterium]